MKYDLNYTFGELEKMLGSQIQREFKLARKVMEKEEGSIFIHGVSNMIYGIGTCLVARCD